ncbi:solute carrier family 2, facilitated glucose transporter member 5-like [Rhineura floridana]|uniref:solute carrier family 2, facilitated glucose transporter member 5-like n=1 Tax=Rhineura floridana TaxID=261503 RepID=UPI002AC880C8|nr:solute carrier family 2, facilitated glucose transporter member 5-like [Rhineura floridana]
MVTTCGYSTPLLWKGALVITAFSSIICPILLAFANKITVHEYTIFARFYTGICTGIISIVVPLYLGEISPTSLRGGITMMTHLFLVFGLLLAQILSVPELLGTQKGFSILMGISGVMPFFAILLLPFFPESPRYLFIQKKDEEKARQVLKILRDRNNVEEEIEELRQEDLLEKAEKNMNPMKLLWTPTLRWQVITTVVLMGGQQLDGINAVHFYAQRIYLSTGMEEGHAHYLRMSSISMGCCSILLGMCLADSKGHRILFLAGFGICCIICVLLTMTLEMQGTIPEVAYISTCLVQVFLFGHSIAPGPLSSVIVLELFLQSSRSSAFVIAGFVQWFTHFLIGLIFLHVETHIGAYSFLIFWPISVAVFVYIFKFLPEMKGRTFVDIRRLMAIQTAKKIAVKGQAGKQELKKHPA